MREINSYVIEDFLSKIYAAQKTNQKTITIDIKEAQNIAQNLSIVLSRAVGELDKAVSTTANTDTTLSIKMDGGAF